MPPNTRPWLLALALLLPLLLQKQGAHWLRMADMSLLYVMLALGMNVVVGMAGLLDLGYVAFYALGGYAYTLIASSHLSEQFAWFATHFPNGVHWPVWVSMPVVVALAAGLGALLGLPTLKLRGDYLAIVTLGFGEIVRILINNLGPGPFNLTNGGQGLGPSDGLVSPYLPFPPLLQSYYLFLTMVCLALVLSQRIEASRLGRAWRAIREDEVAAQAMGLDTAHLKLTAFAVGAGLGGLAGALFAGIQVFISPEAFSLQESVMIVAMVVFGGSGHVPGVVLGAVTLSTLPEVLRYVAGPLQQMTDGRIDAGVLRPLLIGLAMVGTMLWRPHGLWPPPETRKAH